MTTKNSNPCNVPPFDGKIKEPDFKYTWWSWHPLYPYWSKSCWGGNTIDEALEKLNSPFCNSLKDYHNKLIMECDGKLTEVYEIVCQRPEYWREIKRQKEFDKHEI